MANILSEDDINLDLKDQIFVQDYSPKTKIEGVQLIPVKNINGEDSDFCEILRLDSKGELEAMPGFQLRQTNRTLLMHGAVKAWHIHYNQDDIWYLPPSDHLLVGLWDTRKNSPTSGAKMRIALGNGQSNLLYIPRGIAHGCANVSGKNVNLFYYVNQQFDIKNPDERRLEWDALGADFWTPEKG